MSLEQALAANTAALQALTAALAASATVLPHPAPTSAPFTAAVAPVPTAPEASTDSSPLPTAVFGQPVPMPPSPAAIAAPPTASPVGVVEYDSKGMPWDGRIHASSKNKVADGTWRYKRGCDEAVIAQIEAELRATMGAPAVAAGGATQVQAAGGTAPAFGPHPFFDGTAAVPPVPAAVPAAPAVVPVAPPPVVTPPPAASVAVPVAAAAGVEPAATPAAGLTYESLIAALPARITSGELTATQLQEACEKFGVASIGSLAARPDLVPIIAATLGIQ